MIILDGRIASLLKFRSCGFIYRFDVVAVGELFMHCRQAGHR